MSTDKCAVLTTGSLKKVAKSIRTLKADLLKNWPKSKPDIYPYYEIPRQGT